MLAQRIQLVNSPIIRAGLLSRWFCGAKDAIDYGISGYNGTLYGSPGWEDSKFGAGISLNTGKYALFGECANLSSATDQAVSMWFRFKTINVENRPAFFTRQLVGSPYSAQIFVGISQFGGGSSEGLAVLCVGSYHFSSGVCGAYTTTNFSSNTVWNHGVFQYKSPNWEIYINGVSDINIQGTAFAPIISDTQTVEIGSAQNGTSRTTDASLYDVRFYNRALSADEIKAIYRGQG